MEEKNTQQQTGQSGEQNPTLQQPGSQVADYGNVTGGSANEAQQNTSNNNQQQQGSRGNENGNDTVGNP